MSKLKLTGKSNILKKKKYGINKRELSLAMAEATKCGSGLNALKGYVSLPNFNSNSNENYGFYISDGELVVDSVSSIKEQLNSFCTGVAPTNNGLLRLTFDSIANADLLVGDASNVADWNTFFDLPTYGNPFTSVVIVGNEVQLFGGSNIIMRDSMFDGVGLSLLGVNDTSGCIIELGYNVFGDDNISGCYNLTSVNFPNVTIAGDYALNACSSLISVNLPQLITAGQGCFFNCTSLTSISLPLLTTAGQDCFASMPITSVFFPQLIAVSTNCFANCTSLTSINLPSCLNLGATTGNDFVFAYITGNIITLTIPASLMTNNGGNPDGDIQYLQANNTVTIVTV